MLVEWAGVDTGTGRAWAMSWVSITLLRNDLKLQARAMEAARYPLKRKVEGAAVAARKSPRLGAPGGEEADGDGGGDALAGAASSGGARLDWGGVLAAGSGGDTVDDDEDGWGSVGVGGGWSDAGSEAGGGAEEAMDGGAEAAMEA